LAPGVNFALLDDLKRGRFAYQQCLDLHGMTRQAAHTEVARFISQSRCRDGATCVLVVTGRGKSSPGGTSVLRDALPRWLSRAPIRAHVLAFCTARAVDGGPGAFYVLLRRQGMKPFGEVLP
jgi:DNA-nicking Smr family endonuclease